MRTKNDNSSYKGDLRQPRGRRGQRASSNDYNEILRKQGKDSGYYHYDRRDTSEGLTGTSSPTLTSQQQVRLYHQVPTTETGGHLRAKDTSL